MQIGLAYSKVTPLSLINIMSYNAIYDNPYHIIFHISRRLSSKHVAVYISRLAVCLSYAVEKYGLLIQFKYSLT